MHISIDKYIYTHTHACPPVCICRNTKCIQEDPDYKPRSMKGYFSLQIFPDLYAIPSDLVLMLIFSVQ